MRPSAAWISAFLALLSFAEIAHAKSPPKNAVLLSKVQSLTLRNGKKTTARRVSAIPQLKCAGGSGCNHYQVDVLRCTNSGFGYTEDDVEWTCTASLPPEFKLGSTEVICEGYDSPNDPYILKGSCGVEYRLVLTEAGEAKYGKSWGKKLSGVFGGGQEAGSQATTGKVYDAYGKEKNERAGPFFWIIFWSVLAFIVWKAWPRAGNRRNNAPRAGGLGRGGGPGGGGGGGGGWGWDDPPPPYDAPPPRKPPASAAAPGAAWQPGFWSGVLGGTAAGYAMGRSSGNSDRNRQRNSSWFDNDRGEGSWRNSGGGNGGRNGGGSSGGASSSTPSSSRYESTGFGSTTRR